MGKKWNCFACNTKFYDFTKPEAICPKCGAREIFCKAGSRFVNEMITITGDLISKGAAPTKYICVACGYLEYYLPITKDIQLVREHWERVPVE